MIGLHFIASALGGTVFQGVAKTTEVIFRLICRLGKSVVRGARTEHDKVLERKRFNRKFLLCFMDRGHYLCLEVQNYRANVVGRGR